MTRWRAGARNLLFELSALPGQAFQKTLSDSAQELAAVAGPLLPGASETVSIFRQRFLMITEAVQSQVVVCGVSLMLHRQKLS